MVTLVKLSVLLGPLSEPADRSGPDEGVDGGEQSKGYAIGAYIGSCVCIYP